MLTKYDLLYLAIFFYSCYSYIEDIALIFGRSFPGWLFTLIIIGIPSIYTVLKILLECFFFFPISFFNP